MKNQIKMHLTDLNEDELILIFKYCSKYDLPSIAKVCKQFEDIVEERFNEIRCRDLLIVSHIQNYPELFDRTLNRPMKYSDRLRLHQNWTLGSYQQLEFFQHRENYVTHLQMDSNYLYTASLGEFNIFQRRKRNAIDVEPVFSAGTAKDSTITSLKRKDDVIAGSRSNGSLFVYTDEEGYNMEFVRDSSEPLDDFDFFGDIFVTATKSSLRFHQLGIELGLLSFETVSTQLNSGFETVNFNPTGDTILGTTKDTFHLIDPQTGAIKERMKNKMEIYKAEWVNESSFLYTSYCNPLSLIDTREKFEQQQFTCGRFTATSICYDGRFGVLYGTPLGMVILCDLRKPETFERVFHLERAMGTCSHIINDATHLFASSLNSIHMFDFD